MPQHPRRRAPVQLDTARPTPTWLLNQRGGAPMRGRPYRRPETPVDALVLVTACSLGAVALAALCWAIWGAL